MTAIDDLSDDDHLLVAFNGPMLGMLRQLQVQMAGAPIEVVLQLALANTYELYGQTVVIVKSGEPDEMVDWDITLLHLLGHYRGVCLHREHNPHHDRDDEPTVQ